MRESAVFRGVVDAVGVGVAFIKIANYPNLQR